ncbi:ankyrin repeat domain-containing protein [Roseovarius dicentrarchi]|uniref:ankyrin repeat domain-containing protein n=1 Tax=Roseovarius dicentrarchi TaxID=2250573 RepID=UPI000DE83F42|nr:ankyrin repeat domain-containing protein [Roseovarius dicentrarchi]
MKDGKHSDGGESLADQFIEALKKGFANEASKIAANPEFDLNAQTGISLTVAVELGYLGIATRLVTLGANPNLGADCRKGALVLALENEHFELADLMLQHGAEISARDHRGWTPLIWASIKGYKHIVEYLVERGADLHICSDDGWNAVTGAFFKQHTAIVDFLTENGASFGRKFKEAALLSAYDHGSLDIVRFLIADGVNVNVGTADAQPLLISVIGRGDDDILDLMLDAGADINIRDKEGNPALLNAIMVAQDECAMRLIERGASVNVKGPKWAPIHAAADRGRVELCKALLEADASVDQLAAKKRSALMQASERRHTAVVEFLLENGADPSLRDSNDKSPLDLSRYSISSPSDITKVLQRYGAVS